MPPLASFDSIEEPQTTVGFEIEASESQNGRLVVSNIVEKSHSSSTSSSSEDGIVDDEDEGLPPPPPPLTPAQAPQTPRHQKSMLECDDYLVEISEEKHDDEDDDDDEFYNAIESAISTFTCGLVEESCHACKPLKSALRDPNASGGIGMNRSVSFNKLRIREYDVTLGNHPSAVTGPPVQLDWTHAPENEIPLEEYERGRQPRRNRKQLRLSYKEREHVLFQERGFSVEEVNAAWMEALTIRKQRKETLSLTESQRQLEEAWESTQRKIGRLFALET